MAWKLNNATTKSVIIIILRQLYTPPMAVALGDPHQYECEALATLRDTYLGSFFLEPEDVRSLSLEAFWNLIKETWLPWRQLQSKEQKGPVKGLPALGPKRLETIIYSILNPKPKTTHFIKLVWF